MQPGRCRVDASATPCASVIRRADRDLMHSRTAPPPDSTFPRDTLRDDREPTLRLRFDPPPENPSDELGGVLSEVEQLSHGIDSLLHNAANSAIGAQPPIAGPTAANIQSQRADDHGGEDEVDDPDHEGDDPMIAMFDEDEPSDIHNIDRMLAEEARLLLPNTMGTRDDDALDADGELELAAASIAANIAEQSSLKVHAVAGAQRTATADHAHPMSPSSDEESLEGEFESFESLIGALPTIASAEPIIAKAALAVSDPVPGAKTPDSFAAPASALPASPSQTANAKTGATDAFSPSVAAPPAEIAASASPLTNLEHSQAAGLVASIAAADAIATAPPSHASNSSPANAPVAPMDVASSTIAATYAYQQPVAAVASAAPSTIVAAPSAAPGTESVKVRTSAGRETEIEPKVKAARLGNPLAGLISLLALTNLPLRILPSSMRPMVNALALSLVVWAPAIWMLAPKFAAQRASAAMAMIDAPAHGESTLKAGHGEAKGDAKSDDGHGAASSGHGEAKAEPKKKAKPEKKSKAKSKAKTADAGHASGGGH